jgi:hypothetical protein
MREFGMDIPAFDINNMRWLSSKDAKLLRVGTVQLPDPIPVGEGGVERVVRGLVSFMAPFVAAGGMKGVTWLTRIAHSAKGGAIADMLMNPKDGTMVAMLNGLEKEHGINVVPEFLDFLNVKAGADEDALERLRVRSLQAVEGTILGGLIDGLIEVIRVVKNNPELRKRAIQTLTDMLVTDPVKRFKEGKSPLPVGGSIENVSVKHAFDTEVENPSSIINMLYNTPHGGFPTPPGGGKWTKARLAEHLDKQAAESGYKIEKFDNAAQETISDRK